MGNLQRTIAVPWTPVTPPTDGVAKEVGGSAVAIDFSPDKAQRLIFVLNQNNSQIEIIERATGKHLGSFGRPGAFPGEFIQAHGIAVDTKGNVYVSENRGRRIHKFRVVSP
jgi:DNA-binding beta-propeller fold protein YncE